MPREESTNSGASGTGSLDMSAYEERLASLSLASTEAAERLTGTTSTDGQSTQGPSSPAADRARPPQSDAQAQRGQHGLTHSPERTDGDDATAAQITAAQRVANEQRKDSFMD